MGYSIGIGFSLAGNAGQHCIEQHAVIRIYLRRSQQSQSIASPILWEVPQGQMTDQSGAITARTYDPGFYPPEGRWDDVSYVEGAW
jgi:hypothetical protein